MNLRKKQKYELKSLQKMYDLRHNSILVLKILEKIGQREDVKKRINACDQKAFEYGYENSLKDKNLISKTQPITKSDLSKL